MILVKQKMSFRKKTLTKPNIGVLRKKTETEPSITATNDNGTNHLKIGNE